MNNASRIIEAQRERESSLAGGEARARPRSGLLKGETGARSRRLIRPGLGFAPPASSSRPPGPRAPSTLWNPVFSRRPRGGWVCGWCWGVQVCAVGGTAAPQPQTLVPQARLHKKKALAEQRRGTAVDRQPVAPYTPTHTESPVPVSCGASLLRLRTK